jgi:hypothetical protein
MGDQKLDLARTSRGKFKKCDGHFWHSKTPLKIITTSNSFWTRDDMMMIPIASLVAKMQGALHLSVCLMPDPKTGPRKRDILRNSCVNFWKRESSVGEVATDLP